jgi:hypothetical protein
MHKKMNKKKMYIILTIIIGLILFLWGVNNLIFKEPIVYNPITGKYPYQKNVNNGSFQFILGLGFVFGGIVKWINRNQVELKQKKEKRKNWLKYR